MSSFGQGIQMTPLQLGALVSSIANGGTLYYLQYPRTTEEQANFTPRVKRQLNIESLLPEVRDGMLAAVLYGTARSSYISDDAQALGKTGTCSDSASRLGWFVSYAESRASQDRPGRAGARPQQHHQGSHGCRRRGPDLPPPE